MDDDELERMLAASRPAGLRLKSLDEPRAGADWVKTVDARVMMHLSRILAPAVGAQIQQLKTANAALEARIAELEGRLDITRRLDAIEQRLDAQPAATVRRMVVA